MEVAIRLVRNSRELAEVFRIRKIVFIRGQKVPESIERDKFDKTAKHAIAMSGGRAIGCARVRFVGRKAKLERIAVLKSQRGKGIGRLLTRYLIKYCKRRGAAEIFLYSQFYVKGFYRSMGFMEMGRPFSEAGIKHVKMSLKPEHR